MKYINSLVKSNYNINYNDLDNGYVFNEIFVCASLIFNGRQVKKCIRKYINITLRNAVKKFTKYSVEKMFENYKFINNELYSVELTAFVDKIINRRIYIPTNDFKEYRCRENYFKNRISFFVKD